MADVLYGKNIGEPAEPVSTGNDIGNLPPELQLEILAQPSNRAIGEKEVTKAAQTLRDYKAGKANLEKRVIEDEKWYKLRHWDTLRDKNKDSDNPKSTSAWLFNSIINKHADAMDNFPEAIVLPREKSDEESARTLSSVLPVIMEQNGFDKTYRENWWEKLKHGTAVYGVFWNSEKENGIGDIDIHSIDLLNIFWEPGITDIQKSRNLFIVSQVDNDLLENQWPELKGKIKGNSVDIAEYIYDDTVDNSNKSVVVDWYYKKKNAFGKVNLHYCKFVGNTILYASENDERYIENGYYEHGLYPVVFDVLFPEKGTPAGFGYVAVCKNPQIYIDQLSSNILENAMMTTKKRFFVSENAAVNEDEFNDWTKTIIHVAGEVSDARIKEIVTQPVSGIYQSIIQMKIEELKETAANRDVNSGGTGAGVTAAAAISALQEAGNKVSRDMNGGTYSCLNDLWLLVIENIRQFWDEARTFRITGTIPGKYDFVSMDNSKIKDQVIGQTGDGLDLFRKPIFDLKIKSQKKNPFSRMEENERALKLYQLGFFNPENAQPALNCLEMMDFEGIEKIKEQLSQGQTLINIVNKQQEIIAMLSAKLGIPLAGQQPEKEVNNVDASGTAGRTGEIMKSREPMTEYGQKLAKRSVASVENSSNKAAPK